MVFMFPLATQRWWEHTHLWKLIIMTQSYTLWWTGKRKKRERQRSWESEKERGRDRDWLKLHKPPGVSYGQGEWVGIQMTVSVVPEEGPAWTSHPGRLWPSAAAGQSCPFSLPRGCRRVLPLRMYLLFTTTFANKRTDKKKKTIFKEWVQPEAGRDGEIWPCSNFYSLAMLRIEFNSSK